MKGIKNMAKYKILPDTVTLFNYLGEKDLNAEYAVTILKNVYCDTEFGVRSSTKGTVPENAAMLYIFDTKVYAESLSGKQKPFLPYDEWAKVENKEDCWSLNPENKDFFINGVVSADNPQNADIEAYKISKIHTYKNGTSRMWHREIVGL